MWCVSRFFRFLLVVVVAVGSSHASEAADNTGVITLTSRTFDKSVRDGSVWLVEFYAPWCSHCTQFRPDYEKVAQTLHTANDDDKTDRAVKVAKVDGDAERAISTRFGIRGFPSFYVIDGWNVYEYEGSRSVQKLVDFTSNYKEGQPLPFITSPMGPIGFLQGIMMQAGGMVLDAFDWLTVTKGLGPTVAVAVFCGAGLVLGMVGMIILTILVTPKMKED